MKSNIVKICSVISVVTTLSLLSGCDHKNSLDIQPKEDVVDFLINASMYGEMKEGKNRYGNEYPMCLLGNILSSSQCDKLYGNMVFYAKNTNGKFKKISITDLKDMKMFERVRKDYFSKTFNNADD